MQLPVPIYFVTYQSLHWRDFLKQHPQPDPDAMPERFITGVDVWIIQTYLRLKARGHEVYLTSRLVPGKICVTHFDDIRLRQRPYRCYLVAVRPDRVPIDICQKRIVQNPMLLKGGKDHFLPSWPQPGIVKREGSRGTAVQRVGYVGRGYNMPEELRAPPFAEALGQRGMELVVREKGWHDYHDLDVILAVRQTSPIWATTKPASKLTNGWLAGCPVVASPDPAYQALRQTSLDYLEAQRAGEVLAALERLRSEGELYRAMVENGVRRGGDYDVAAVSQAWESLLAGPVAEGYREWQGLSYVRRVGLFVQQIGSQVQAQLSFRRELRKQKSAWAE